MKGPALVTARAESGSKCCIVSSNKWVINSGAFDHVTGNPKILFSFWSHKVPSPVTIIDGSNCNIEGSGTVKPTSSIPCHMCQVYLTTRINTVFSINPLRVYIPFQNGVAEKKNRHLLETAHALSFQMKVAKHLWANVICTTNFLINCTSSIVA